MLDLIPALPSMPQHIPELIAMLILALPAILAAFSWLAAPLILGFIDFSKIGVANGIYIGLAVVAFYAVVIGCVLAFERSETGRAMMKAP